MSNNVKQCTVFVIALGIALYPIFATTTLPLYDYPNHLARMHVLVNWETSGLLQQFYTVQWKSLPNLAMELVVPTLSSILTIETAGKVFIALIFLTMAGGAALVHHSLHGRWSAYSLIAFMFLYNGILLFGFMNYLFSVGMFLILFALWVRFADWSWFHRLIVFSGCTVALFYMHLYGLGLYGIAVVSYEVSRSWSAFRTGARFLTRDWIATLGQFIVPFLIFVWFSPTSSAVSHTSWENLLDKWHYYGKVWLLFDVVHNYQVTFDMVCAGLLAVIVVGGLAFRLIVFSPHTLLPFLGLSLAFILMPKTVFSSWAADDKFTIALALFFVAVTTWQPRSGVIDKVVALGLAGMFLVRMTIVANVWHSYDQIYQGYRTAIAKLPEGARLTAAIAYRGKANVMRRPSLNHLGNLITLQRDGFYPTFFAHASQQPVSLMPSYDRLAKRYRDVSFRNDQLSSEFLAKQRNPFAADLLRHFDYILVVREHLFDVTLPPNLIPVHLGADFKMYRIGNNSP